MKYDIEIDKEVINGNLKRITNQIYKLLPTREEGINWELPLETIMEELSGMQRLLEQSEYLTLLSKLEGLFTLKEQEDFFLYRRTIFECLGLVNNLMVI